MTEPKGDAPRAFPITGRAEALRRAGLLSRIARRTRATTEIVVPALPSMVPHYVDMLADQFASIGRPFSNTDLAKLGDLLAEKAAEGFAQSPYSNLFIRYGAANDGTLRVDYAVAAATSSIAEEYAHWVTTREPPLFGKDPDARLIAALDELAIPTSARCLDVGAGTGRNTLPLARRGHPVVALEPAPALADVLEAAIAAEDLPVSVVRADVLAGPLELPAGGFALALASQVTSHFRGPEDLRSLLATLAAALAPGGHALVNAFMPVGGYVPDRATREASQVFWSTIHTRAELDAALDGLPLRLVSDEDALAFERAHQPPESWPPTSWYEPWARGEDLFGELASPAISLRWLLFRREPAALSRPSGSG